MVDVTEPKSNFVTLPRVTYDRLMRNRDELFALNAAGVDNWEGYGEAMGILYPEDKEENG